MKYIKLFEEVIGIDGDTFDDRYGSNILMLQHYIGNCLNYFLLYKLNRQKAITVGNPLNVIKKMKLAIITYANKTEKNMLLQKTTDIENDIGNNEDPTQDISILNKILRNAK